MIRIIRGMVGCTIGGRYVLMTADNGVFSADAETEAMLVAEGFAEHVGMPDSPVEKPELRPNLSKMTKAQLLAYADELDIDLDGREPVKVLRAVIAANLGDGLS